MLKPIILLVVLIFLNATFASAEIAVISINEAKLKKMSSEGNKKAKKLLLLTKQPARFLATIQVAITLAGLLQSAFAAENFADPLVKVLVDSGVTVSQSVLKTVTIIIITLILSYFNLVFGELVPKRIAMKKAESMALGMSRMLYAVSKIFAPLVWLLTISTNGVLRLLGINPNENEEQVTEEEIQLMLSEGKEQGNIQQDETELIKKVFEFNDISVGEICTHRMDMIVLNIDDPVEVWHETVCANRHKFYPVVGLKTDEIVSILDAKDYFRINSRDKNRILKEATDEPFYIPESMKANVLFDKMKKSRRYFAIVLDEYGGVTGIITLHDLMEALVGNLGDDSETEATDEIIEIDKGVWKIQGVAPLREVSDAIGYDLDNDECDTFSGYISSLIGRIPDDGEKFTCETERFTIEVQNVKKHVIETAIVRIKEQNASDEEEK